MESSIVNKTRKTGSGVKTILRETVQFGKKIIYHLGVVPRPFRIQIDVTDGCNFRCPTCLKRYQHKSVQELNLDAWEHIFEKIKTTPLLREVTICGGEPFTRPDILNILKLAKSKNLYTVVVTNGWYQNDDMMRSLSEIGVDRLMVSLNSLDESVHDASRNMPGSHKRIMDLIALWQENDYTVDLCLETIIMERNVHEISALADFVHKNKLNGIIYQVLAPSEAHYPFSKEKGMPDHDPHWYEENPYWIKSLDVLQKQVIHLIHIQGSGVPIINPKSQMKKFVPYYQEPEKIRNIPCLGMMTTLYIDPFGHMRLCYGFPPIGNVLRDDPIQVWYSKGARELRRKGRSCRRLCRMLNNNL